MLLGWIHERVQVFFKVKVCDYVLPCSILLNHFDGFDYHSKYHFFGASFPFPPPFLDLAGSNLTSIHSLYLSLIADPTHQSD